MQARFCSFLLLLACYTDGHSWEDTAGLISEGSLNNFEAHPLPTPPVHNDSPSAPETLCLFPLQPEGTMADQRRVASTKDPGHNLSKRLKPSQDYQGQAGTSLVIEGYPATLPSSSPRIPTESSYDRSGKQPVTWKDRTASSLLPLHCIDSRNERRANRLGAARLSYGSKELTSSNDLFQVNLSKEQPPSRGAADFPASRKEKGVLNDCFPVVRLSQGPHRTESTRFNLPQIEHLRGYYSFQTLDWIPSKICLDAALGAYALVPKFKSVIAPESWTNMLAEMDEKYGIFIPFIYKLMIKSLSCQHWTNILSVWKGLWEASNRVKHRELSEIETLKLFLGISDLITELTIPQLFGRYDLKTQRRAHATRILRVLSAGRSRMNQTRWVDSFLYLAKILIQDSLTNPQINLGKPIDQEAAHDLVLQKIKLISHSITANTVDILISKSTGPPFNTLVSTFQDTLMGKTKRLIKFQNQWPAYNMKSRIEKVLHLQNKLNDQEDILLENSLTSHSGDHEIVLECKLSSLDHQFSNIFRDDEVPALLISKISQILKSELSGFVF
ncbi:hypothetical protein PSTG_03217 [Puccinia striiformis f. sp. tritici PST-78]|uniref:Ras-GEF domain-containing protein n=1 Tax=Puccinia striiformis f. sp. tritici PST-78 TaxID=1165861 RepID=A0A0L0VWP8_9BASI|nr:hypothetical protein PSTG_03217 [Puccinia striiformis f. sp. tritici PST-78]